MKDASIAMKISISKQVELHHLSFSLAAQSSLSFSEVVTQAISESVVRMVLLTYLEKYFKNEPPCEISVIDIFLDEKREIIVVTYEAESQCNSVEILLRDWCAMIGKVDPPELSRATRAHLKKSRQGVVDELNRILFKANEKTKIINDHRAELLSIEEQLQTLNEVAFGSEEERVLSNDLNLDRTRLKAAIQQRQDEIDHLCMSYQEVQAYHHHLLYCETDARRRKMPSSLIHPPIEKLYAFRKASEEDWLTIQEAMLVQLQNRVIAFCDRRATNLNESYKTRLILFCQKNHDALSLLEFLESERKETKKWLCTTDIALLKMIEAQQKIVLQNAINPIAAEGFLYLLQNRQWFGRGRLLKRACHDFFHGLMTLSDFSKKWRQHFNPGHEHAELYNIELALQEM